MANSGCYRPAGLLRKQLPPVRPRQPQFILEEGTRAYIAGDSADLWLKDYNCRVSSPVTVLEAPRKSARKVLVCIDVIDGDHNVTAYIRRSRLQAHYKFIKQKGD